METATVNMKEGIFAVHTVSMIRCADEKAIVASSQIEIYFNAQEMQINIKNTMHITE